MFSFFGILESKVFLDGPGHGREPYREPGSNFLLPIVSAAALEPLWIAGSRSLLFSREQAPRGGDHLIAPIKIERILVAGRGNATVACSLFERKGMA